MKILDLGFFSRSPKRSYGDIDSYLFMREELCAVTLH